MQILKQIAARYLVVAYFDGKTAKYYAKDWEEAMEWLFCYPVEDGVEIFERFLGITAAYPIAHRRLSA